MKGRGKMDINMVKVNKQLNKHLIKDILKMT